ncbi:hypothetical protein [Paraburkholderia sacchari]|uniref:hypothetical protein n=1 Tax=Paraburkholderia sacchari TaxID=159450 RepID=UPI001BCDF0BA|nr:hypothetical protein [Paraburkholderia sacchari]
MATLAEKDSAGDGKAVSRLVLVTRFVNDKTEIYDTGHFAPWITDFDAALQAEKFDD